MKFSELKRQNAQLAGENLALKALSVEQLRQEPGQPKKLRVAYVLNPTEQAMQVALEPYLVSATRAATRQIIEFFVAEGVVRGGVVENPKTKERALVFEMKVIP